MIDVSCLPVKRLKSTEDDMRCECKKVHFEDGQTDSTLCYVSTMVKRRGEDMY